MPLSEKGEGNGSGTLKGITIIGGGLAGSEAAWQAAERGLFVTLHEMRPQTMTPAHKTGLLAELVCSNSFKSNLLHDASGLLKEELRRLGSLVVATADENSLPAGSALAVDRTLFASSLTRKVEGHPRIHVLRGEIETLPLDRPLIIATGPLTSDRLSDDLQRLFHDYLTLQSSHQPPNTNHQPPNIHHQLLYFYDAIAPIVSAESINKERAFRASRYEKGGPDYLNFPLNVGDYLAFWKALLEAEQYPLHSFEDPRYFGACLPIEELARRGRDALRFGPMRPVGLIDPQTGLRPYAVLQLRQENREATMYNLVGFQTRLRWAEQRRVFRMVPGMEEAEFLRYGSMHRNTFISAPLLLKETLQFRGNPLVLFAGQITGAEGYTEAAALGYLAGVNAFRLATGKEPLVPPPTTALGSLVRYLASADPRTFQPMNFNFGLLPPLEGRVKERKERHVLLGDRALKDLEGWKEKTHF